MSPSQSSNSPACSVLRAYLSRMPWEEILTTPVLGGERRLALSGGAAFAETLGSASRDP